MSLAPVTVGILTVSDRSFRGEREDQGGPAIKSVVGGMGWRMAAESIVPDDVERIRKNILNWIDEKKIDLVLTTGGTGIGPRDVTPEATRGLIEKELPGLMELVRFQSARKTPWAVLSRAVAGVRKKSLIVNLPGNPEGAKECLEIISDVIPHALAMIHGQDHPHSKHKECAHVDA